jgi:4-hydroxy-2-oxoheptanedioate aldolase
MEFPRPNSTKRKLSAGGTVYGPFIGVASATLVELCGHAGFDYVVIDCEHGPIDFKDCEDMIRAAELYGVTPIVRVPGHDPKMILRYLDIGAQGLMLPNVVTAEQAIRIVEASLYAPVGKRGLGPARSAGYGLALPSSEYAPRQNEETLITTQLENVAALDDLDALVQVPGVDVFMLGTADLSASMGFPGERTRPEVQEVKERFVSAVLAAGRILGDTAENGVKASEMQNRGYRMLDCSFTQIWADAASALVSSVREAIA